jgi:hypothetical protein
MAAVPWEVSWAVPATARRHSVRKLAASGPDKGRWLATLLRKELRRLVDGLRALSQEFVQREEREAAALRVWCGGSEPFPAEIPQWSEGSLGDPAHRWHPVPIQNSMQGL